MSRIPLFLWCGVLALGAKTFGETPGLYADFTTTMGTFTCQLEFTKAPRAVANFVGLATSQKTWIDESTGQLRSGPFFNDLTFHRVIAGFMIQTGSPNGAGTDGPGYAFPDEFHPTLRHDGPGVLSSANSGPNSNRAQFFVTAAATPWLNDVHTVFGRVVSGQQTVDAINQVPTGPGDKPITPVRVTAIAIRRIGPAAEEFDIHAQNLPVVSGVPLSIALGSGESTLTFSNLQHAAHRLISTTNLTTWIESDLGITLEPSSPGSVTVPTSAPRRFFTMSRVQYPSSTFAPASLQGRTLALAVDGSGVLRIEFDETDSGCYTFPPFNPGTITEYTWTQDVYRGQLWPIFYSELVPMTLRLDFSSETAGAFTGTAYATMPFAIGGSFTLTGP